MKPTRMETILAAETQRAADAFDRAAYEATKLSGLITALYVRYRSPWRKRMGRRA